MAATLAAVLALAVRPGGDPPAAPCEGGEALDFACHERRLVALTEDAGPRAALRELERGMRGSGYLRGACHQLVHRIGGAAAARGGMRAFADGGGLCRSGYYHGVTEAVMREMGAREAVRRARTICAERRAADDEDARAVCTHGMGHGFMHVHARDLRAALAGCDALAGGSARRECYSGVFMENHAALGQPPPSSLRPREPLFPCTALARRYKGPCYARQTTYALFVRDGDVGEVLRLCGATERAWRAACRRGLGGDVAAETAVVAPRSEQARARRRLCLLGRGSRARADCVTGVVRALFDTGEGDVAGQVDALCAALSTRPTQPEHAACLRAAATGYRALVSRQTGDGAPPPALDLVCDLKKTRGGRRSST